MTDFEKNVHYHDDLIFESEKGDLIIIDEVDHFIYGDTKQFYFFQQNKKIIGFTVTASTKEIKGLERSVFECIKFHEATYWPSGVPKPYIDYSFRGVDVSNTMDLCRELNRYLRKAPVLVYCTELDVKTIGHDVKPAQEIKTRRDFRVLTQLDITDHMGRHELILATTEEEMRGVNLRAPMKGVKLVIAKPFSCQRNADQGLMRVGRYGDPCERLICSYVDLVDDELAGALNKRLFAFAKAHQPKVKPKAGPFADGEYYSKMAQKQDDKIKQQRAKATAGGLVAPAALQAPRAGWDAYQHQWRRDSDGASRPSRVSLQPQQGRHTAPKGEQHY